MNVVAALSSPQAVVLGIDAAWTANRPSGVALVAKSNGVWRLLAATSSIHDFVAGSATVDIAAVVATAERLAGRRPDLVAVDMPMMDGPISGRRASDNAISAAYGRRGASTHSPLPDRPGAVGRALEAGLSAVGYPLATHRITRPCRIEIYPHPALIELMAASYRLPYKVGNTARYWPGRPIAERRARLADVWQQIVAALDTEITGTMAMLPSPSTDLRGAALKAGEDRLDAVISAYAGAMAHDGRARCFGDSASAIWVPTGC